MINAVFKVPFVSYKNPNLKKAGFNKICCDNVSFGTNYARACKTKKPDEIIEFLKIFISNNNPNNKANNLFFRFLRKFEANFQAFMIDRKNLVAENRLNYIIKKDNKIIGGAILEKYPEQKAVTFEYLAVDKKYQRTLDSVKPIYNIIQNVISECKKEGINNIRWKVYTGNKSAMNLYSKVTKPIYSDGNVKVFHMNFNDLEKYMDKIKKRSKKLFSYT